MTTDKPACHDFLIEAARALRRHPGNMQEKTAAGVRLQKLFAISMEAYTEDEFRAGLKFVVDKKKAVLIARTVDYELTDANASKKEERYKWRGYRWSCLSSVPVDLPTGQYEKWQVGEDGMSVIHDDAARFSEFVRIMFYVTKDGLPKKIADLVGCGKTTAQSIIEAMLKKKPIPKKKK